MRPRHIETDSVNGSDTPAGRQLRESVWKSWDIAPPRGHGLPPRWQALDDLARAVDSRPFLYIADIVAEVDALMARKRRRYFAALLLAFIVLTVLAA